MMDAMTDGIVITEDAVLGGRLRLRQPALGHRAGHDAILLAAATSAQAGQKVIEFGAGVGTAGLALARRVPGVILSLVEIDPQLAELAKENAAANDLPASVMTLDIGATAAEFTAAGLPPDFADVVLMNPPFHDAHRHRASPDTSRQIAHLATPDTLQIWIHAARRALTSGGVLTMIWRADGLSEVLEALGRGFGSLRVLPVHGDPAKPAIRILVRAVKGGRAPLKLDPGIALRDAAGQPDAYINDLLTGQAVLPWAAL